LTDIKVKQNFSQQLHQQKCFIIWVLFQHPHVKRAVLLTAFDEAVWRDSVVDGDDSNPKYDTIAIELRTMLKIRGGGMDCLCGSYSPGERRKTWEFCEHFFGKTTPCGRIFKMLFRKFTWWHR